MRALILRRAWVIGLTLLAPAAWAQTGSITGKITDARSNQPVGGARVLAQGTAAAISTISHDDGTYRLTGVPAGSYSVSAVRIGYAPALVANIQVTAGETVTADVQMTETATELNPVVTVASRKEEKELSAPASVSVVDVREVEERPSVTVADHLNGVAGIDISKGGIAQSNVVARGFNNAFSGSVLMLQDYRFAAVPSLRVNVPLLFTASNEDVERVEVLLGPASALYGPNSSNGVIHVITKSPFTSQGTTLTMDGGTRSLFRGAFRHAAVVNDKLAWKVSGEYFTATDWKYTDLGEPDSFPASAPAGRAGTVNNRDFSINRYVGEARVDMRPTANSEYVSTLGISHIGSALEYTGANGTALAKNWNYVSAQQRMRIGRLFAQVFANFSDAGNRDSTDLSGTYLLRSGQPIVDQSRVIAAQIQDGLSVGKKQDFVFGLDYINTNPRTGHTINGRNEDIDNVREIGGYVQSTTNLTPKLDFIAAMRLDNNDQISGEQFSPRAAIVFKPSETQNLRFTYNRAFSTPANFTWFLDLIQLSNVSGTPYNVRAVGNPPKTGWTFNRTCSSAISGGLCMRTIFLGPAGESTWEPATAAVAYQGAIATNGTALVAGLTPSLAAGLGVPSATAQALAQQVVTFLGGLQPTAAQIGTQLRYLGAPASANLTPTDIKDIGPIKASFSNSYELGYKGILGGNVRLAIDAWREQRGDVGNPAGIATPSVFFDPSTLQTFMQTALVPVITGALEQQFGMPAAQAQATAQAVAPQIAGAVAGNFAPLPLGIVQFNNDKFADARDVYATYSSYEKTIWVTGVDVALDAELNGFWSVAATYSYVNHKSFPNVTSSNQLPLMLNAPADKASLTGRYRDDPHAWSAEVRLRYTDAYPVNSGVYATGYLFPRGGTAGTYSYEDIHPAAPIDITLTKRFHAALAHELLWSLAGENVFNHGYRTMPGMPLIGRMITTRLQYQF